MKNKLILAFCMLLCLGTTLNSQNECVIIPYYEALLRQFPSLRTASDSYLARLNTWLTNHPYDPELHQIPVTIPVAVHVLYKNPSERLSRATVESQLALTNQHFRKRSGLLPTAPTVFRNLAFDCLIQFQLVVFDERSVAASHPGYDFAADDIKKRATGIEPRNPDHYLNIWLGDLKEPTLLGYAPWPEYTAIPKELHGVVVDYTAIGPSIQNGTTLTHEIGHFLGLRHIWATPGCAVDDDVTDTPIQDDKNFGCPASHTSCGNSGDMFVNFMDYTDCKCMFTKGQAERMWGNLNFGAARALLTNSPALGFSSAGDRDYSQDLEALLAGNPYESWPAWKASLALVSSMALQVCEPPADIEARIRYVEQHMPQRFNNVAETIRASIAALALDPEELLMSYTALGFRDNVLNRRSPVALISTSGTETFGIVITGIARVGTGIQLKIYDPMNNGPRIANCSYTNSGAFKVANYTDFMVAVDNAVIGGKRIFLARSME